MTLQINHATDFSIIDGRSNVSIDVYYSVVYFGQTEQLDYLYKLLKSSKQFFYIKIDCAVDFILCAFLDMRSRVNTDLRITPDIQTHGSK